MQLTSRNYSAVNKFTSKASASWNMWGSFGVNICIQRCWSASWNLSWMRKCLPVEQFSVLCWMIALTGSATINIWMKPFYRQPYWAAVLMEQSSKYTFCPSLSSVGNLATKRNTSQWEAFSQFQVPGCTEAEGSVMSMSSYGFLPSWGAGLGGSGWSDKVVVTRAVNDCCQLE